MTVNTGIMDKRKLNIQLVSGTEPAIIELEGILDRQTVTQAFRSLRPVFDRKTPLVLDLGGLLHMDSSGLALLAYGFRKLGTGPSGLSLRSATSQT